MASVRTLVVVCVVAGAWLPVLAMAQLGRRHSGVKACVVPYADASARELARTAETTVETYATDRNGYYAGVSPRRVHQYERSIPISRGEAIRSYSGAWLVAAWSFHNGEGYAVITLALSGNDYEFLREPSGNVHRFARQCGHITNW